MGALVNHPGMWLRDDAADAINALEAVHGVIRINRAGVTEATQQEYIDRWDKGGVMNRPPYLYPPARPARSSEHVQGIAVDVYNYTTDRAKLEEFGFEWYGKKDPVHYKFKGWTPPASEENEMIINIKGKVGERRGGLYLVQNGVATFIGARSTSGYPAFTNEKEIAILQSKIRGLR